ncbi:MULTISPECIES: amino acid ABC transporter permease [unclassified Mesorhizobium]|uniref:amino acid ABC transporter permease n=1 Tax=unclassified Mesorhizobium TaxID=325217 RepID=UPI000FC9C4AB|nr:MULTISPECIES: amino acid ABC transporter permease [unclassified Mesorhizobium]RUX95698.1 amino acid ABC transporter permease [Mesorhizobium sp. M7D.F.Ca.US.004.01.2.1]RVA36827.1 amino acid ABC transporter permease [Mesorhizobium sp. M7D.F.Ca.US.004.03.1.1]
MILQRASGAVRVDVGALNQRSYRIVRLKHVGRWIGALVVVVALALLVQAFAYGQIHWATVGEFLTAGVIVRGFGNTLLISFFAMIIGVSLGTLFAIMRLSANPVTRFVAWLYVWVFRGTPVMLQLLIWFNIALVFPRLVIPGLYEARMVDVVTPFVAALLGLGINEGAYMTEVVRGGISSVDHGQTEAAKTLGMSRFQTLRRIILPQAMRLIIPVMGNSAIGMLKFSSLAAAISMGEMLNAAQQIYFINGAVIELLFVCGIWYLAGTTVLSIVQYYIEQHFGRGVAGTPAKFSFRLPFRSNTPLSGGVEESKA